MNEEQELQIRSVFYRNYLNVLSAPLIQEILTEIKKILDHEGEST